MENVCQKLPTILKRLNPPRISGVDLAQRKTFKNIIDCIELPCKSSALSISTGDGFWDYFVFKNNSRIKKIIATDIVDNPVTLKDCKLLNKLGEWKFCKVGPESNLNFDNNTFDLIYHQDVIEHVEKPYLFLREQYRVLKKGGHIIIGTPNLFRPANMMKLLSGALSFPIKIGRFEKIGDYIHQQEFCEYYLRSLLKEIGFINISTYYSFFGIHFLNIKFSSIPKNKIGKSLAHYLNFVATK